MLYVVHHVCSGVILRKARGEHMFSEMPPIAAGSEPCQHLRSAPQAVIC